MKRPAVLPRRAGRGRSSACSRTASPRRTARSGVRGPGRPVRLGHRTDARRRSGEPAPPRDRLHPQLERCDRRGVVRGRWDDVGRGGPTDDRVHPWRQPALRLQRLRSAPGVGPARRGARAGDGPARRHRDDQAERHGRRDAKPRDHRPLSRRWADLELAAGARGGHRPALRRDDGFARRGSDPPGTRLGTIGSPMAVGAEGIGTLSAEVVVVSRGQGANGAGNARARSTVT